MGFTKDKDTHNQKCCDRVLETVEDYVGGGSHYWVLKCEFCKKEYSFDTYSFKLMPN